MLQGPKGEAPATSGYAVNKFDSGHEVTVSSSIPETQADGTTRQATREEILDPKGNTIFTGSTVTVRDSKGKVLSKNTERSDGKKQAIAFPKAHDGVMEPRFLSLERPSNWSVSLGAHYGRRHFKNSQTLDHNTFGGRLGFGIRLHFGKLLEHKFLPKLYYDFTLTQKTIVNPIRSQAQLHSFGLELAYLNETLGHWLYVGAAVSLGATIARTQSDRYGMGGVLYNDNPLRRPLNESAMRVELGPRLCTWGMRLCLDAKMVSDLSLDPSIGSGLRESLSATGLALGLSADIMQFFSKPSPKGYLEMHRARKQPTFPGKRPR